jgi:hypothetical protein
MVYAIAAIRAVRTGPDTREMQGNKGMQGNPDRINDGNSNGDGNSNNGNK